jgi:hypothetical protein
MFRSLLKSIVDGMREIGIMTRELQEASRILDIPHYEISGFEISNIFVKLDHPFLGLIGKSICVMGTVDRLALSLKALLDSR